MIQNTSADSPAPTSENKPFYNLNSDLQCIAALILCVTISAFTIDISSPTAALSVSPTSPVALLNLTLLLATYLISVKAGLNIPNSPYAFIVLSITIIGNTFSHSLAFLNLPFSFLAPMLILSLTKSYTYCIVSLFVQLINISLLFRVTLEDAIKLMSINGFAERLTQCFTLGIFVLTFFFAYIHYLNDEKKPTKNIIFSSKGINNLKKNFPINHEKLLENFISEVKSASQSVAGSLDLLLNYIEPGLGSKLVKIAMVSSEDLQRVIQNLVDLNKNDLKVETKTTPCCFSTYLKEIWEIANLLIQKKGLEGNLKIDLNLPEHLELDTQKVKQVVLNLVSNLLQVTNKGTISLEVEYADLYLNYNESREYESNDIDPSMNEVSSSISLPAFFQAMEASARANYLKYLNSPPSSHLIAQKERMVKITVRNSGNKLASGERLEDSFQEIKEDNLYQFVDDNMSKLGLYVSQEMCGQMGGNLRTFNRNKNEMAFVANIPFKEFSMNNHRNYGWTKIW